MATSGLTNTVQMACCLLQYCIVGQDSGTKVYGHSSILTKEMEQTLASPSAMSSNYIQQ